MREQVVDELALNGAGFAQRIAGAQRGRLAVLDPVEVEREGGAVEAVERGDDAREPVGRGVEEVRAAAGVVAGERGDLLLDGRRGLAVM